MAHEPSEPPADGEALRAAREADLPDDTPAASEGESLADEHERQVDGETPPADDETPTPTVAGASLPAIRPDVGVTPGVDASLPAPALPTSTPPKRAWSLAFVSIIVGGLCGGLIGWAFTDLQCDENCATWTTIGGLVGAVVGAVGVGVVANLALRAMAEWQTVTEQEKKMAGDPRSRRSSR